MKDIKTRDARINNVGNFIKESAADIAQEFDYGKEQRNEESGADYASRTAGHGASKLVERSARSIKQRPHDSVSRRRKRHVLEKEISGPRTATKTAKKSMKKSAKSTGKTIKAAKKSIKTTRAAVKATAKTTKTAARVAKRAAQAAQAAAKAVAQGAKVAVKASIAVIKALVAAVQGLIAIIAAGGWVAVVVILLICFIAYLAASPFGIFLSTEGYDGGMAMPEVVQTLNQEYYDEIDAIKSSNAHNVFEIQSSDGKTAIDWVAVLRVYSVLSTTGTDSDMEIATLDDAKIQTIRSLMWEMNEITYTTRSQQKEVEVIKTDINGKEYTDIEYITETVLTIHLVHLTEAEIMEEYRFSENQIALYHEMNEPGYQSLWIGLIGSYRDANGQVLFTDSEWLGTDIFSWPLQHTYEISSPFGWRMLRGEPNYHEGLDIAAPFGTPIIAAANGEVIVSNATDNSGFGYGLYVKIRHNDTIVTTYAHCSAVAVLEGQLVTQGQVIGYVGSTGNSTGNHVHFEVIKNGAKIDPLQFFAQ